MTQPNNPRRGLNGCCVDRQAFNLKKAKGRNTRGEPPGCDESTCMDLPEGESCATCVHTNRCVAIFGAKPENTWCDFFPRRFRKRALAVETT